MVRHAFDHYSVAGAQAVHQAAVGGAEEVLPGVFVKEEVFRGDSEGAHGVELAGLVLVLGGNADVAVELGAHMSGLLYMMRLL